MEVISKLLKLLLSGDGKDFLCDVFSKFAMSADNRAQIILEIENFMNTIENKELADQIQSILGELHNVIFDGIKNRNINVLDELNETLDRQLQLYEISADLHNNIKDNLKCYILYAISKNDINFYNDLYLNDMIEGAIGRNIQNEEDINRLKRQIQEIRELNNALRYTSDCPIKSQSVCPDIEDAQYIIDRGTELEAIQNAFDGGSNLIYLCGRPGMGKTTLAKMYARKSNYKHVYYERYNGSFSETIKMLAKNPRSTDVNAIIEYLGNNIEETKSTLLIIDNFDGGHKNDPSFNEKNEKFLEMFCNVGVKIIITTRRTHRRSSLQVGPVGEPIKLFESYCGGIECDYEDTVKEIVRVIHENTLLIILAARLWEKSDDKQKGELLHKLTTCSIRKEETKLTIYADIEDTEERTLYDQVNAMLDFRKVLFNETNRIFLENATLLPLDGLDQSTFINLMYDNNEVDPSDALAKDGWIIIEDKRICLHPLIREILINKDIVKYEDCQVYCKNIGKKIAISEKFDDRIIFKNCAQEIYNFFSTNNSLDIELARLFYSLSDIYDELGAREISKQLANTIINQINVFDNFPIEKARVLSGIAYTWNNNYKDMDELNHAGKLLENAYDSLTSMDEGKNKVEYVEAFGKVLSNRGSNSLAKSRCNQNMKNQYLEEAIDWHNKALNYRKDQVWIFKDEKDIREIELNIATSYTTLATDYYYEGEFEKSIENHMKSIEIRQKYKNYKGVTINQQRIIGCVIEYYRKNFVLDAKYIDQVMNFYPKIIEQNYKFHDINALKQNLEYLNQLKKIVNSSFLQKQKDDINAVYENVMGWCNRKPELVDKL